MWQRLLFALVVLAVVFASSSVFASKFSFQPLGYQHVGNGGPPGLTPYEACSNVMPDWSYIQPNSWQIETTDQGGFNCQLYVNGVRDGGFGKAIAPRCQMNPAPIPAGADWGIPFTDEQGLCYCVNAV